jgi:DNA repair exonuclease SbcCD nuclease subunit
MIKKIIACSDIHIRNLRRQEEYVTQLKKFISDCQKMADEYGSDSIRIVVAGDILHNKLDISGEGYTLASWFLGKLDDIAETIVIAGNHDMNMSNTSRMDPLSAIFKIHPFKQTIYLDQYFEYSSGCYVDDNVVWCLYSSFENFAKPNIEEMRIKYPENTFVALFHGELKNAKTDAGYVSENGRDAGFFEGVDFGILGHIHKRQCIRNNGVPLVYCGSLIQQDHGENISAHGYVVWDVEEQDYEEIDIPNDEYGFYTFSIKNIDDIEEDKEEIINL